MKILCPSFLAALLACTGCMPMNVVQKDSPAPPPAPVVAAPPPKPVTADQVTTTTAHKSVEALWQELDRVDAEKP